MASSQSSDLPAKPIRFFKIVLSDIGSHSKLMIPRKFARIFGENLNDSIFLNASGGSVWPIDLERHEGKVWMQNGWPEFAKFYSICVGYLLLFEYQGDSKFQVLIFDPSSSEIEYPLANTDKLNFVKLTHVKKRVIDIDDSSSPDDSTTSDDSSSSDDVARPCKKMKTNSFCIEAKLQQEKGDGDPALASAKAYKSKNPFFIQSMTPSNIGHRRWPCLHITRTFEEAYKNWKNNDKIILQVAGRTWAVYCSLNLDYNQCRIRRGWIKFVRDNSLNVCDVCVFELINPSKKLVQVVIFRATKEKHCEENKRSPRVKSEEARVRASVTVKSCKKTSGSSFCVDAFRKRPKSRKQNEVGNGESGKDRALASAKTFKSKNPFFMSVMQPFHVNRGGTGLYITRTFEEAYKKWKKSDEIILQVAGRTWQVSCNVNLVLNQCRISRGWTGFVRGNLMNVGDVCVFELINTSRKLFNVFIFRADKETNFEGDNRLPRIRSDAEQARAYTSVNAFKSKNPYFTIKVCPSYLYGGSVCLPKSFIKRYVTEDHCDVILQIGDRRVWSVKCRVYKGHAKFDAGWSMFVRESNLSAGGYCAFELIDSSRKLFNVAII